MSSVKNSEKEDSKWFKHDQDAHGDPKIVAMVTVWGMEGYGMWWRLLELLRSSPETGYAFNIKYKYAFEVLADVLRLSDARASLKVARASQKVAMPSQKVAMPKSGVEKAKRFVRDCIDEFKLFEEKDGLFFSRSMIDRMKSWEETKIAMSERGRKGAEATNRIKQAKKAGNQRSIDKGKDNSLSDDGENSGESENSNPRLSDAQAPQERRLSDAGASQEVASGSLKRGYKTGDRRQETGNKNHNNNPIGGGENFEPKGEEEEAPPSFGGPPSESVDNSKLNQNYQLIPVEQCHDRFFKQDLFLPTRALIYNWIANPEEEKQAVMARMEKWGAVLVLWQISQADYQRTMMGMDNWPGYFSNWIKKQGGVVYQDPPENYSPQNLKSNGNQQQGNNNGQFNGSHNGNKQGPKQTVGGISSGKVAEFLARKKSV
jgi:hypothetical protein